MDSHFKYKLHIIEPSIDLLYDDTNTIGSRIREVREVKVLTTNDSFIVMFDERFNELDFIYEKNNNSFDCVKKSSEFFLAFRIIFF